MGNILKRLHKRDDHQKPLIGSLEVDDSLFYNSLDSSMDLKNPNQDDNHSIDMDIESDAKSTKCYNGDMEYLEFGDNEKEELWNEEILIAEPKEEISS